LACVRDFVIEVNMLCWQLVFYSTLFCACLLMCFGCRDWREADNDVVAWVEKNGIGDSRAPIGRIDLDLDFDGWVAEGRAMPNVESRLLRVLQRANGERESVLLVLALSYVGTSKSVPALVEIAKHHDRDGMRHAAISSLGEIGTPECLQPLVSCLMYDSCVMNQLTAAHALARIGDAQSLQPFEKTIERMCEHLEVLESCPQHLRHKLEASQGPFSTGADPAGAPASEEGPTSRRE
jgi:hypothetical protein